ncbi:ABC transporter ATP-binding protein [Cryomorpha ignava]|uniref:ABC transporter ATP-binding protein n=1 Tax=Cryomorpha ignava TaxID=101383 RepID=A0A7K3WQD7_9FLAO|nr:ABC transporter ATP-binding protein [Cryomorpha ignava]NEN23766.1 ABC transporter ATP-binding protein [Cryomorpha ignava]
MTAIQAENISISYHSRKENRVILTDFNLAMQKGEMLALIGSNGSGKSSLLRVLSGLQESNSGKVFWNQRDLSAIARSSRPRYLSNLFSNYARVDGFSVFDLVSLGRQPYTGIFGKLKAEDEGVIIESLEKVGMSAFWKSPIGTLSDGEFRKVMLAKMLAQNAPVMILDEPTTHLDLPSGIEFLKLLKKLARDEQKTILLSSHNISLVFKMVDKIVLLNDSGRYISGTPKEVANHELMCSFLKTSDIYFENENLIFNPKL